MDNDHIHDWHTVPGKDMLACSAASCKVVTSLSEVLRDHAVRTKAQVLSAQLYARELKKEAHDKAYSWVVANAPSVSLPVNMQGTLL